MTAMNGANDHDTGGDDQDFVAVTSSKNKNRMSNSTNIRRKNNKGKGRWEPPVEKPLTVLLEQKIDLLRSSAFLQACLGMDGFLGQDL